MNKLNDDTNDYEIKLAVAEAFHRVAVSQRDAAWAELENYQKYRKYLIERKVYVCKSCEGVYADVPVSKCDCTDEIPQYYEGIILYKTDDI